MKEQLFICCLYTLFLVGCSENKKNISRQSETIEKRENFDDSLKKYKVKAFNDSCIKYLYGINGFKLFPGYDSALVGMCIYRPWINKKKNDSTVLIFYVFYYKDSIPISTRFGNGKNFHSFEIDTKHNIIDKVFFGQETSYMKFEDFLSEYNKEISSKSFKNNLKKYSGILNQDFKKYFFMDSLQNK